MICSQKDCRGSLYCVDSRSTTHKNERIRSDSQIVLRRYCCVECGSRYVSTEVLNSQVYKIKPMPEGKLKQLIGGD